MNNHHPLCYNDEWIDDSCELCQVINYVIAGLIPPCTCGHEGVDWWFHTMPCKFGAFKMSQDRTVWEDWECSDEV